MSHTPGPWTVEPCADDFDGPISVVADARTLANGMRQANWIAECDLQDDRVEENHANAHLIAAAPELLEAVRAGGRYSDALLRYQEHGVRGQLIPPTDELERLFLEWHDKGHAAIAKAEGR